MGTRHLIGVITGGRYKVAQYGQWDGYIKGGQGEAVLEFLRTVDLYIFKEKIKNCYFVLDNEIREMYVSVGDSPDNHSGFVSHEIAEALKQKYPSMSRDTGAKILNIIYDSDDKIPLVESKSFLTDSTFCEFAYVINLDKNFLICYANGKKEYARYELNNLPSVEKMEDDYNNFFNIEKE